MKVFCLLLIAGWLVHPGATGLLCFLKKRSLGQNVMCVGRRSYFGVILVPASCALLLVMALIFMMGGLADVSESPVRLFFLCGSTWVAGLVAVLGVSSFRVAQVREGGIVDPEGNVWRWDEMKGYFWSSDNRDRKYIVFVRKDEKKEVRWGTRVDEFERLTPVLESKLPGGLLASLSTTGDEPLN